LLGLRISFDELSSVEIGRGALSGSTASGRSFFERRACEQVLIAALGGVGLPSEVSELLAGLRAEHVAAARVAVVRRARVELRSARTLGSRSEGVGPTQASEMGPAQMAETTHREGRPMSSNCCRNSLSLPGTTEPGS
jgi:hypothetical protein